MPLSKTFAAGAHVGLLVLVASMLTVAVATAHADESGDYTQSQAKKGARIYAENCAACHGATLQGQAGPALAGPAFEGSLQLSKMSAAQLFHFISTQMPADHPGSLKHDQYLDVFAFILSSNGYPVGQKELSQNLLARVKMLPYPGPSQAQAAGRQQAPVSSSAAKTQTEVVKNANVQMTTGPGVPSSMNVIVSDPMLQHAAADNVNWLAHGRDYANQRYSALDQINSGNITHLVPVALIQTGITGTSFETTPVVINGVMYITTGVVDQKMKVMAVNAATGETYWQTTFTVGANKTCCGADNRGVAVAYGNVYFVTLDDKLVALDARSGKLEWQQTVADPQVGYSETMAPQVLDHELIIGSAGGEWPIRGFVAAYSADSGKQLWRWQATDPKSFTGDSWKQGGGMVWTTPAVDTKLGLVIFSTGNPNPDLYGGSRTGDNLYTDSIVALDAKTGKTAWYYQEVKHDVWDYDAVSNVVLFNVEQGGKTIPAAGEAGKVGWFFIVDRRNGHLIRKSQPYVMINKNMFTPPSKAGVQILPGANGGAEWSPPAFSPKTRDVYVLAMNQLMNFTTEGKSAATSIPGQMRLGSVFANVEKGAIQNGVLSAINVDTGEIAWKYHTPQPLIGGALATAGNLVFFGEGDGSFDALDATSGKRLWRFNLGAGVNAPPVTYEVDGTQYIAVAAGGNFQLDYPWGDTIAIFKLAK